MTLAFRLLHHCFQIIFLNVKYIINLCILLIFQLKKESPVLASSFFLTGNMSCYVMSCHTIMIIHHELNTS